MFNRASSFFFRRHHARLSRIEHKLNACLQALQVLLMEKPMSRLHDDLLAIANEVDSAADRVIAAKTEGESQMADVLTRFEAVKDKLNAAAADNAASGSSTGAGSGSGSTAV